MLFFCWSKNKTQQNITKHQNQNMNLSRFPKEIVNLIKDFVFRRIPKDDIRYSMLSLLYQDQDQLRRTILSMSIGFRRIIFPYYPGYTLTFSRPWYSDAPTYPGLYTYTRPFDGFGRNRAFNPVYNEPHTIAINPNITWDTVQDAEHVSECVYTGMSRPLTNSDLGNAFRKRTTGGEDRGHPPQMRRMDRQQRRNRRQLKHN